jgi:hypothetical protein
VEPVPRSRLESLARNIPLLGKRYRHPDYVPPTPLRKPANAVPPAGVPADDVTIDVKVYVNPAGKVEFSEVLSKVSDKHRKLADFAVFSARRWEFVPAHEGDSNTEGEVILHYQFGDESRAGRSQTASAR